MIRWNEKGGTLTTETETKKKPPAHEVIVALLREYARVVQQEARVPSHTPAASLANLMQRASVLTIVLMRMHIPEKDRQWVLDALHHLPPHFLPPMAVDLFAEIEGDKGGA